jgi:ubiquinol-cytochrome c reductase iron-sulfur subunit/rieske iron-sulfur protein
MVGLGMGLAAGSAFAQEGPASRPPQPGDFLVRAKGNPKPLTVEDLKVGAGPVECWALEPSSGTVRKGIATNRLLVFRFNPQDLDQETAAGAANGVLAMTNICTHAGCEVTEWVSEQQLLECPCHFSRFDPRRKGAVAQGPATRDLPTLGLSLADGKLTVAKSFVSKVGGDVG